MDVTPDGSVWLSGDEGRQGLFRLGEEPVFEYSVPASGPPYLEVAPDGSLWAIGEDPDGATASSRSMARDGQNGRPRPTTRSCSGRWPSAPTGRSGWRRATGTSPAPTRADCTGTVLLRLEDDGSLTAIEDWADVYDGDVSPDEVAVSPDGDVWLIGQGRSYPHGGEALLRFDGEGWEAIPGPEGWKPGMLGRSLDFGPDGALWVNASTRDDDGTWAASPASMTPAGPCSPRPMASSRGAGRAGSYTDLLTVAPDGSLWLNGRPTAAGCGGVAHWDGTTWTSYLGDSCIHDLAIAPDGSVWLRADADGRVNTYVIRPEAGATTE